VNIPMVNETSNIHSVMENVDIEMIEKWYQFLSEFLGK
jgi:di/tripeptidase